MNYLYLALAVALFGGGVYVGRLTVEVPVEKAALKVDAQQEAKRITDTKTVAQEARTYEAATDPLKPIDAPHVSLCYYQAAPVPNISSPRPRIDAATPVPAAPKSNPVPGPDVGRPILQVGRDADAQIVGLQDYIAKVCGVR